MSRKRSSTHTTDRDTFDIASDSELVRSFIKKNTFSPAPLLHLPPPKFNLKPLEDRRAFHPDGRNRPVYAEPRSAKRLVASPSAVHPSSRVVPSKLAFAAPKGVIVCIRRKNRREVLFATGRTKKGSHAKKSRTAWSEIKCSTRS